MTDNKQILRTFNDWRRDMVGEKTQESLVDWRSRCVVALSSVLGQRTVKAQQ